MMRDVSAEFFIFQQDSAPAHLARDTVRILELATPAFIPSDRWPPNSPDLNPVDIQDMECHPAASVSVMGVQR